MVAHKVKSTPSPTANLRVDGSGGESSLQSLQTTVFIIIIHDDRVVGMTAACCRGNDTRVPSLQLDVQHDIVVRKGHVTQSGLRGRESIWFS